jgi:hypothetical protein
MALRILSLISSSPANLPSFFEKANLGGFGWLDEAAIYPKPQDFDPQKHQP